MLVFVKPITYVPNDNIHGMHLDGLWDAHDLSAQAKHPADRPGMLVGVQSCMAQQ